MLVYLLKFTSHYVRCQWKNELNDWMKEGTKQFWLKWNAWIERWIFSLLKMQERCGSDLYLNLVDVNLDWWITLKSVFVLYHWCFVARVGVFHPHATVSVILIVDILLWTVTLEHKFNVCENWNTWIMRKLHAWLMRKLKGKLDNTSSSKPFSISVLYKTHHEIQECEWFWIESTYIF
jgi:hypothetical protein